MSITLLTNSGTAKSPDIWGKNIVWIEDNDIVLFDGMTREVLPDNKISGEQVVVVLLIATY